VKMTAFLDVAQSLPWWWRQQAPLKRRPISTRLHGAISQKTSSYMPPWEPEISPTKSLWEGCYSTVRWFDPCDDEVVSASETSADLYQSTWRNIPEGPS
jgi:hypothetical protein